MNEQPAELRYRRDGVDETHEADIDRLATLFVLNVVIGSERPFAELHDAARTYLIAAFQMGRAAAGSPY